MASATIQLTHVQVYDKLPSDTAPRAHCVTALFGADERGNTACVFVSDWEPSVLLSVRGASSNEMERLAVAIGGTKSTRIQGKRLFDFHLDKVARDRKTEPWLQVRFATLKALRGCKRKVESLFALPEPSPSGVVGQSRAEQLGLDGVRVLGVYEQRVAPETKFLDELGVPPCGWINVSSLRPPPASPVTHCRREGWTTCAALSHADRDDVAPVMIASVDIECRIGDDGSFPTPNNNPIICIGTVLARPGPQGFAERRRIVHCLRSCDPIDAVEVNDGFEDELAMLSAWRDTVVEADTVVFTGYNVWGFDYRYMAKRHNVLLQGPEEETSDDEAPRFSWAAGDCRFPMLSMFREELAEAREKTLCSAAMGFNKLFEINATGRITLDLLMYVKVNYALSRYTLNAVAEHFVGDVKDDIEHTDIYEYYEQGPAERARYCAYCVKDCDLPIQLCEKLSVIPDYVQTSRVQWTQLSDLVSRGQQIRVFNMLHNHAHRGGYVIDRDPQVGGAPAPDGGKGYEGATVLSPIPGFYQTPIATLDFASLYPSIMRAHNLCYSTRWVEREDPPEWLETETHAGITFVTDPRFRGVLPRMLDELLGARKATKKEMARETDPVRKALLDKKQLAQKVSANSVYGFTGAIEKGMYPCRDVAQTTTSRGRTYIDETKGFVEQRYGLTVIYGDTDSVMVDMGDCGEQAYTRAAEIADYITDQFPPAIILEFEKVYCPYLLKGKKRYVGCKREAAHEEGKMDCKGIEMTRRDNAPIARDIQRRALTELVMRNNPTGAVEAICSVLRSVVERTAPFEDYVITKAVAGTYKNNNLTHVRVAEKLKVRGIPLPAGGRIEFVILRGKQPLYERAEDADYARKNRCIVDRAYYIEKQLATPLKNLLGLVMDLEPLFAAALAHVRLQYERSDRQQAMAAFGALGVTYKQTECATPTFESEAVAVVESVARKAKERVRLEKTPEEDADSGSSNAAAKRLRV